MTQFFKKDGDQLKRKSERSQQVSSNIQEIKIQDPKKFVQVLRVSLSFHQKQFQSGVIWFEKSFKSFLLLLFFAAIVDVDLSRWTNTNKVEPKWKWKCRVESFFALRPTNASWRNLKSLWVLVEFLIKNQIDVSVNISRYKCNHSLNLMSTLVLKSCAMYE